MQQFGYAGPSKNKPGTNTANTQGPKIKLYTSQTNKCVLHDHTWCQLRVSQPKIFSLYLTTFACQFHQYMFTRLPFRIAPAGEIFQRKIYEIFKGQPNIFGIADDILFVGYGADSRDNDRTLRQVIQICHWENFKIKKK